MDTTDDIDRCISRLANIRDNMRGRDYSDQRAAAAQAREAATELLIDMAETLNWLADTGALSRTDRNNIRAYVHDGFIEAVSLADERGNADPFEEAEQEARHAVEARRQYEHERALRANL